MGLSILYIYFLFYIYIAITSIQINTVKNNKYIKSIYHTAKKNVQSLIIICVQNIKPYSLNFSFLSFNNDIIERSSNF
jgi:hypothetical protein